MDAEHFEAGDIVQVKSGGPRMTVYDVGEAAMTKELLVWCEWFDGPNKKDGTFHPASLRKLG
jgi:uncharacterized protein YodC (DUF2158 family)